MTFPNLHSLDGVSLRDCLVAFAYAPWFEARYVMDDNIIMSYVRGDHLSYDISLLAIDCDDFQEHTCVVYFEMKIPKLCHRLAR